MSEVLLSRRNFISVACRAAVGGLVAGLDLPASIELDKEVASLTELPAGETAAPVESDCQSLENAAGCIEDPKPPFWQGVIEGPFLEEVGFRAAPSILLDTHEGVDYTHTLLYGTESHTFTRKEFGVGLVSALLFGAAHNLSATGFDTSTIPASQTFGGMVDWALQRKLGFMANWAEHTTFNSLVYMFDL